MEQALKPQQNHGWLPKAAGRRLVRLVLWLGLLLVVVSLITGLALRGRGGSQGGPRAAGKIPEARRRTVAIAYVDVARGVTPLGVPKPGRVAEVWAVEGKEMEAGDKLFRMEDEAERLQFEEARVAREVAKQRLTQAHSLVRQSEKSVEAHRRAVGAQKSEVKVARQQYQKIERLFRQGLAGSREDVDAAAALLEKAEAALAAGKARLAAEETVDPYLAVRLAELDVEARQKQWEKARYALERCTVLAPERGTVLRCNVHLGETVGPMPRQPAIEFCPGGSLIVRAEVEQEFASRLAVGQGAIIHDDTTRAEEWRGTVESISRWYTRRRSILLEPLQFNDVRTLECIIRLDPAPYGSLRIGQRVRVTLEQQ